MDANPHAAYPPGVHWDAPIETGWVPQVLAGAARRYADKPALTFLGRTLSYAALDELATRFAAGLQALGVGPGVHVGLYLPNTPHYPIAFFGVLRAGGVVVNYSPLDAERVIAHKVDDSETDILITLDARALYPQMERLLGRSRLRHLIVGTPGDFAAAPELVTAHLRATGELADVRPDPALRAFTDLLANDGAYIAHALGDPATELAALQYTGGTTGLPKGAMLTHANLTAAVSQCMATAAGEPPVLAEGAEITLAVLPPFHIYALVVNMLFGLRLGAHAILLPRFEVEPVLDALAAHRVTIFCGVPTMFVALLAAELGSRDLTSLRLCNSGGAPLPLEVQTAFQAKSGTTLNEGWGMTETSAMGTFTPARAARRPGSCGLPVPAAEFRFLDVTDPTRDVAPGEVGEIAIRGPNVMRGYWKNEAATRDSFTADGFFRTGDVGRMDADGFITIVDRTKDMLLCGGFNVYPRLIEEAIYRHPAVAEVAVIGIADPYRGQSPKAFVVLRAGVTAPDLEAMRTFLKPHLGKHEMIAAMEIRENLPRTPVGKLDKKALLSA